MLPTNLNTNEVKTVAGAEIEYLFRDSSGRAVEYSKSGEAPYLPQRLKVSHQETGSGLALTRRSLVSTDRTVLGQVDNTKTTQIRVYTVAVVPLGQLTSLAEVSEAMANHVSFLASRGASTTILYDGTGCGAEALINGSL